MIKNNNIPSNLLKLEVFTYGQAEKINDTLSKARVRIFYKGANRNRTFISDDFAEQLIKSLPYTPVKGIFEDFSEDYTDHGEDNSEGRIYGIIPENPNFAWEKHLDKDGITREYATADVYIFSALYPEAKLISERPQSMEIFRDTLQAEWKISEFDGLPYLHFISGSLIGLQVLGQNVEPCFEGAAFYSYKKIQQDLQECINYIKQIEISKKDGEEMSMFNFKTMENETIKTIFSLLNTNYTEENDWQIDYVVLELCDEYAICFSGEENKYFKVNYTAEDGNITLNEKEEVSFVSGESFDGVNNALNEKTNKISELEEQISEFNKQIEAFNAEKENFEKTISDFQNAIAEKDSTIESFTNKINDLTAENSRLETEKNDITNDKVVLEQFKLEVENKEKENILEEFSAHLTDEMIENFTNKISEYTVSDFKKEVCTKAYETDKTMFSHKEPELIYTGSQNSHMDSGAIRILKRYKTMEVMNNGN